MATLVVPDRYLAAAPIIITSPSTRCGTTLVQRLLSASDNAFIYGEEVGHQIKTLTGWFFGLLQRFEEQGETMDVEFAKAIEGRLNDWRPGLMAPAEVMQRAWVETYYQLPATLADYGRSIGRPIWGFKTPSFPRDTIRSLLLLMPQAKVIYVYRNLFEALKSAKARKFAIDDEQVSQFCAEWAKNMSETAELVQHERVLFLRYEGLLEEREEYLKLLTLFTGATGVDPKAFDLKVNTYAGQEAHGHSPTQYIRPARLTDADRATVLKHAGGLLESLYGEAFQAA